MLHGFGGTHRAWDGVLVLLDPERYRPLAVDLPGHGIAADAQRPITFTGCVEHVLALAPERFVLCGYSLGGRIALRLALAAPARVSRLVLVSSSPGIADPGERARRREADEALARDLEQRPFEEFIARWRAQPLFDKEPPEVARLASEDHRRNRPEALAAVMRGIGTGVMEPLWESLDGLDIPTSLIAGKRDTKFLAIARAMHARLPRADLCAADAGHGVLLESPAIVAGVIAEGSS